MNPQRAGIVTEGGVVAAVLASSAMLRRKDDDRHVFGKGVAGVSVAFENNGGYQWPAAAFGSGRVAVRNSPPKQLRRGRCRIGEPRSNQKRTSVGGTSMRSAISGGYGIAVGHAASDRVPTPPRNESRRADTTGSGA